MRGAPQSGLAACICRIRARRSALRAGRPGRCGRDLQRQASANARRCQRTTVSGVTIWTARRQSGQSRESRTHRRRSAGRSRGRVARLTLEDGELVPKGEDLRLELEARPDDGPEGGEQGDERRGHAGRKR